MALTIPCSSEIKNKLLWKRNFPIDHKFKFLKIGKFWRRSKINTFYLYIIVCLNIHKRISKNIYYWLNFITKKIQKIILSILSWLFFKLCNTVQSRKCKLLNLNFFKFLSEFIHFSKPFNLRNLSVHRFIVIVNRYISNFMIQI